MQLGSGQYFLELFLHRRIYATFGEELQKQTENISRLGGWKKRMKATLCMIALIFISGCFSQASAKSEELTSEMKNWHNKIAASIYDQFSQRIKSTILKEQKLSCSVQYSVTAKGRIKNIQVTRPSDNKAFDKLVVSCLRSFSGDPLLKFPPGTKESQIQKTGVLFWNAGKNRDLPAFLRGENDTYEGVDTNDCEILRTPQMLQK